MEATAGVGERRQLARVYTTALCSRRPHRAVSSRAKRTFLFVRTPLPLSFFLALPPAASRLSLSLSLTLLPCSGKDNSPLVASRSFALSLSPPPRASSLAPSLAASRLRFARAAAPAARLTALEIRVLSLRYSDTGTRENTRLDNARVAPVTHGAILRLPALMSPGGGYRERDALRIALGATSFSRRDARSSMIDVKVCEPYLRL